MVYCQEQRCGSPCAPKLFNPVLFFGRGLNSDDSPEGQQLQADGAFGHVTDTRFIVIVSRQDLSEQKWIKRSQRETRNEARAERKNGK
jgi:hypothetical protein